MCVTIKGHTILGAAHIDDVIIACADRATLDAFCQGLLARFNLQWHLRGRSAYIPRVRD